jgi:hypothetical protein
MKCAVVQICGIQLFQIEWYFVIYDLITHFHCAGRVIGPSVRNLLFPNEYVQKVSPVTDLDWPRGFQEVKVPRFHDNGTGRR